jgi:predicted metal-dependent peptidase
MAHEIMHCVLNHIRRGKSHDPEKSNTAADYEVNVTLEEMKLVKADVIQKLKALYDKKYAGWGYEKIYDDNPKGTGDGSMDNSKQSKDAQQNSDQNQQGQGSGGNQNQKQQYSDDYKKGWNQAMEDYKNGTAILIGNEGNGLRKEVSDKADIWLKIPMCGQVESLNAAIAASVFMFEVARQRRKK